MDNCKQTGQMKSNKCSDFDVDRMPVGMAYVPWQVLNTVYEPDRALQCGTIFPELNKPFLGKRGVR